jgi:carbonic anhydrase
MTLGKALKRKMTKLANLFRVGRRLTVMAATLLPVVSVAQVQTDQKDYKAPIWSYSGANGPEHWSDLSPDFAACNGGKKESPVDLGNAHSAKLPSIHLNSRPAPLRFVNTGFFIRQNYAPGNGNTLTVGDKTYELQQLHFHHPAEEAINGKHYPMVAHYVYQNKEGQFAVLGIPIKQGRTNRLVTTLWEHLPTQPGKEVDADGIEINAIQLIPAKLSYYRYEGSLTTPPCTEGVTFYILDTPAELSKEQIDRYGQLYPDDARPIQPLNGRVVEHKK